MKAILLMLLIASFLASAGRFIEGDKLSAFVHFVFGLHWFYLSCKD